MLLSTKQIAEALSTKFSGQNFTAPDRYNRRPGTGFCVPGKAKWTRAIGMSGIGCAFKFWSGSNPTPSTQYPIEVKMYIESIDR
jgi:hypothetical protein